MISLGVSISSSKRAFAWLFAALAAIVFVPAFLAGPASASANLAWSAPVAVNPFAETTGLDGVSCLSPSECVAVDSNGQEVTFNPQAPQGAAAL